MFEFGGVEIVRVKAKSLLEISCTNKIAIVPCDRQDCNVNNSTVLFMAQKM